MIRAWGLGMRIHVGRESDTGVRMGMRGAGKRLCRFGVVIICCTLNTLILLCDITIARIEAVKTAS